MRVVTSPVQSALEQNKLVREAGRLTVYKSRVFFEEEELTDNAPIFAHPAAETGLFIPEAISFATSKFVTVSVTPDGVLQLMRSDSDTPVAVGTVEDADPYSRPGIFGNNVFYRAADGSGWRRCIFDEALLIAGDPDCLTEDEVFSDFTEAGAIFPTSEDDAFLCHIDGGAIAVALSLGGADSVLCPSRFINPVQVYDPAEVTHVYLTHFAGAAATPAGRFFYFSEYDGSIKGVRFSNGMFSDFFTSIPSDLSISRIGNVFSHNGIIHMTFRFERSEEFTSFAKYTHFSQSKDGVTFNLDQRVLVTMADYRFMAAFDPGESEVIFSATNRSFTTSAPYQIVHEDAPATVTKLISISGGSNGFDVRLKSGAEQYFDDEFIIDGAYAKLEIGVQSSDGDVAFTQTDGSLTRFKFITYHDVVVAEFKKDWIDGDRDMSLQIIPDGLWHTSVMTHPMYMEVQGKQGIYDPAQKLENLYKFAGDAGIKWSLTSDIWAEEGKAYGSETHTEEDPETDHWGPDLTTILTDYPVFGDEATYEVYIYGWSRGGQPDTNPNTADPTDVETPNDDFFALIETEDSNGNVETVVSEIGDLSSTYSNPPQSYFEDHIRPGSVPVTYDLPNPGEGKKIKRLGVRVVASTGQTTYYVERVEMPGIAAQYKTESVAEQQPWEVKDITSNWPLVDELTLQITTDNASDGDQVEMNYTPKPNHVYAIAIVGDVAFRRNSIDYLQDAHFVASIPASANPYAAPTWDRSYPPGTGPTAQNAVEVEFDEWPYYPNAAGKVADDVVRDSKPQPGHAYLLHWADDRFADSTISAGYIPYFFSAGNKLEIAFYIAGSGAISNIERGAFKIYIYESAYPITDFDFYGGDSSDPSGGGFEITASPGAFTPGLEINEYAAEITDGSYGEIVRVKNPSLTDTRNYRCKILITGVESSWYINMVNIGVEGQLSSYPTTNGAPFSHLIEQIFSVGPGDSKDLVAQWYYPVGSHSIYREWQVFTGPVEPDSNQIPAPPEGFEVLIPELGITLGSGIGAHLATSKKGEPQIIFSNRPYSAFNFEVTGRFHLKGPYSQGGLLGLGEDENNFMLGYIRPGHAGIARVRAGVRTDIYEQELPEVEEGKMMDARFWHRDGIFGIEVKRAQEFWPQRGSHLLYEWDGATDDTIATNNDIFHVGAYALIDPPKLRTTGFRGNQSIIGVMPLDLNPDTDASGLSAFPTSGKVDIGGRIYEYTGKNEDLAIPRGPFHLRSAGTWPAQFNSDRLGYTYPNTRTAEFLMFNWWDGATHAEDYAGNIVASSEGYAWPNEKTLWRVWITTGGALVWIRNRARFYSSQMPEYYSTDAEKMWLTNGLTGVSAAVTDDLEYVHPVGCFAFIHSDDSVSLHGFTGFSGERDNSIMNLLDTFCKIAGTEADPFGDFVIASHELDDNEEVELG